MRSEFVRNQGEELVFCAVRCFSVSACPLLTGKQIFALPLSLLTLGDIHANTGHANRIATAVTKDYALSLDPPDTAVRDDDP